MSNPVGYDFADLECPHYTNINRIYEQLDRLHGPETLFGDWNATLLVIGQDFDATGNIQKRFKNNPNVNPFHHSPNFQTNKNLVKLLSPFFSIDIQGSNNRNCGVYYANAYWLLKNGESAQLGLENKAQAVCENRKVFRTMIQHLGNLKVGICLGSSAFQAVAKFLGVKHDSWRHHLEKRIPLISDGVKYFAASHTGAWGIKNRMIGEKNIQVSLDQLREDFAHYVSMSKD